MLHTGIPAYANRNRILARLVASFLLLCTTSGVALCSKFGGVWETLWIFKVVRWTHNRCTKINKSPTVSNGRELHPLRFELQIFCFQVKKINKKPVGYTTMYLQTGKNTKWAEMFMCYLLLTFKVVYQDHLTQSLPFTWDFREKGQWQVWGQMG